jgi:hypothetical protein
VQQPPQFTPADEFQIKQSRIQRGLPAEAPSGQLTPGDKGDLRFLEAQKLQRPQQPQSFNAEQAIKELRDPSGTTILPQFESGNFRFPSPSTEAGIVAMGRGLFDIGRGIRRGVKAIIGEDTTAEIEEAKRQDEIFSELDKQFPTASMIGRATGQSLPFLAIPVGGAGFATTIEAKMLGTVLTGTIVGGLQAGVAAGGEGKEAGDVIQQAGFGAAVGSIIENAFPVAGRVMGSVLRRISPGSHTLIGRNGEPSPQLRRAMEEQGVSADDITEETARRLVELGEVEAAAALRQIRFEGQQVQGTKGDITQDFAQKKQEAQLLESADPQAEELRGFRARQAQQIEEAIERDLPGRPTPEETGLSVKQSVSDFERELGDTISSEYRLLDQMVANTGNPTVIPTNNLRNSFMNNSAIRRFRVASKGTISGIRDVLQEFKIIGGGDPTIKRDLTLGNAEELRQALNSLFSITEPKNRAMLSPIIKALDDEIDNITARLSTSPITQGDAQNIAIASQSQRARDLARQRFELFPEKGIVTKLIGTSSDGRTSLIESSQVMRRLYPKGATGKIEEQRKVLEILEASGPQGRNAIRNMQSSAIIDLMESAFSDISKVMQGQRLPSSLNYNKRLEQMGKDGQIDRLFKNNKAKLKRLRAIGKTLQDITPSRFERSSKTGNLVLDLLKKTGLFSVLRRTSVTGAGIADLMETTVKRGETRFQVEKAIKFNPRLDAQIQLLRNDAPGLATALGIPVILEDTKNGN